jgi:hypothetical protein
MAGEAISRALRLVLHKLLYACFANCDAIPTGGSVDCIWLKMRLLMQFGWEKSDYQGGGVLFFSLSSIESAVYEAFSV